MSNDLYKSISEYLESKFTDFSSDSSSSDSSSDSDFTDSDVSSDDGAAHTSSIFNQNMVIPPPRLLSPPPRSPVCCSGSHRGLCAPDVSETLSTSSDSSTSISVIVDQTVCSDLNICYTKLLFSSLLNKDNLSLLKRDVYFRFYFW